MATLKVDDVEVDDATAAIIAEHRQAMPLAEYLAWCIWFGARDMRDGYQNEERDFAARSVSERMALFHRMQNQKDFFPKSGPAAPHVVRFAGTAKEKD